MQRLAVTHGPADARADPLAARARPRRWSSLRSRLRTIRVKLFGAFLAMSAMTACLGLYGLHTIRNSGALMAETYDGALMSISYARAASSGFAALRADLGRLAATQDPAQRSLLETRIAGFEDQIPGDVAIARERALSAAGTRAAERAEQALAHWFASRADPLGDAVPSVGSLAVDPEAVEPVEEALELLVEQMAGDGFVHRQRAVRQVERMLVWNLAAVASALLLTAIVSVALARRLIGPVAAASRAASRIAAGELDTPIPEAGQDELGQLLAAMTVMRDRIRAKVEAEIAAAASARFRLVDAIEGCEEAVLLVDRHGAIAIANGRMAAFFPGLEPWLAVGRTLAAFLAEARARGVLPPGPPGGFAAAPDAATGAAPDDADAAHDAGAAELRLSCGRWLRIGQSPTREGGFVAIAADITGLKTREAELERINASFEAALDNMSQGLVLFDAEARLQVANRRFEEIFGLAEGTLGAGLPLGALGRVLAVEAAGGLGLEAALVEPLGDGAKLRQPVGFEVALASGAVLAVRQQPVRGGGWVATVEDVTERRRAEFLARHDALTGLPNRLALREAIGLSLQAGGCALLCLDLDRFTEVNVTLGQAAGDQVLVEAARRLQGLVGEEGLVARIGGDEFAILVPGSGDAEEIGAVARRLPALLAAPLSLEGLAGAGSAGASPFGLEASVGIALGPTDGAEAHALLRAAEVALGRARSEERGHARFFEEGMNRRLQARRSLERDLRAALAEQAFTLNFQPLLDLSCNRIGSFEALLRWTHPERGPVSPAEFVPVAEGLGLIRPIGTWVLRTACAEAVRWPDPVRVAVNVSPLQFAGAGLVESVAEALAESGLDARRLEIEVTESVLIRDPAEVLALLTQLKALGVRIAMDDFGTGYSSLATLRAFPFDKIKIDQGFVRTVEADAEEGVRSPSTLLRAMVGLGRTLGMRTTAEGVETEAQLALLRAEGCDEAQGWLIGRPMPGPAARALLAEKRLVA